MEYIMNMKKNRKELYDKSSVAAAGGTTDHHKSQ